MDKLIDLRSDTVTKPTPQMRLVMAEAEVGDDVYGEDPSINALQDYAANLVGTEAALYVPSGTQANVCCVLSHCNRGDEYIVGQEAHIYLHEAASATVLGSLQPQPLHLDKNGFFDFAELESVIKPDDIHFAKTKLLCVENTYTGKVLPLEYLKEIKTFADKHNLATHLDGARIMNACVHLGIEPREMVQYFDSVMFCLSKGLGAPVGSILCGTSNFVKKANQHRKRLGGGMRQAGIVAAGGLYALQNHVERLKIDHENAALLREGLSKLPGIVVDDHPAQTNMVVAKFTDPRLDSLHTYLKEKGIIIFPGREVRLVTHLDVSRENIETVVKEITSFVNELPKDKNRLSNFLNFFSIQKKRS